MGTTIEQTMPATEQDTTIRLSVMSEELRPRLKSLLRVLKTAKAYSSYAEVVHVRLHDETLLLEATDSYRSHTLSCRAILAENLPASIRLSDVHRWLDEMPAKGPCILTAKPDDRMFPNLQQVDPGVGEGQWFNRKFLIEALQALDGVPTVQLDGIKHKPLRITPVTEDGWQEDPGFVLVMPMHRNDVPAQSTHDD